MSDGSQCGPESESASLDNLKEGSQDGTDSEEVLSESTDEEVSSASSDEPEGVPECKRRLTGFSGRGQS